MIWFDRDMTREAAPSSKHGCQRDDSNAAIQTCRTMKVLFGMALRQTTGFVESLLRLIGLDWAVPDFSTLSRRQKTSKVIIPCRGSDGPLHLLVESTGIKVEGKANGTPVSMAVPSAGSGARSTLGSTRHHWESGPPSAPPATWAMLPELLGQIPPEQEIATVTADGAFDTRNCNDPRKICSD